VSVRSIPGLAALNVDWQSFDGPNGHRRAFRKTIQE
jgi:hypothetical protein